MIITHLHTVTKYRGIISQNYGSSILFNELVTKFENDERLRDFRFVAYLLATVDVETNGRFVPREFGGDWELFNCGFDDGKRVGNKFPGDGVKYRGRGFVPLIGRELYELFGDHTDVNLVRWPSRALEFDVAYEVLVHGALLGEFTGKSLSDYFADGKNWWLPARRIFTENTLYQHGGVIADKAQHYYATLQQGGFDAVRFAHAN